MRKTARRTTALLLALFLGFSVQSCAAPADKLAAATEKAITEKVMMNLEGSVTYRERMALPPTAMLEVRLLETGADGQRHLLAETRAPLEGLAPPLPFRLVWPAAAMPGGGEVEARILEGETPLFAGAKALPALDEIPDALPSVDILVRRVFDEEEEKDPQGSEKDAKASEPLRHASLAPFPASYENERGDWSLFLLPDHSSLIRQGHETLSARWHILRDGRLQIARPGLQSDKFHFLFQPEAQGGWRLEAPQDVILHRVEASLPTTTRYFVGRLNMKEDGILFRDCASGRQAILRGGAGLPALEKAYQAKRRAPDLLAEFTAHLTESVPEADVLAVDSFNRIADEACPGEAHLRRAGSRSGWVGQDVPEALAGKRWRLLELNGQTAQVYADQPEPCLIFRPRTASKGAISGADGCNAITGNYVLNDARLRFLNLGATMSFCHEGMEQAAAYARALDGADSWRLTGNVLELLHKGQLAASFEAVAL